MPLGERQVCLDSAHKVRVLWQRGPSEQSPTLLFSIFPLADFLFGDLDTLLRPLLLFWAD